MSKQIIKNGDFLNDPDAETVFESFEKSKLNFDEIYTPAGIKIHFLTLDGIDTSQAELDYIADAIQRGKPNTLVSPTVYNPYTCGDFEKMIFKTIVQSSQAGAEASLYIRYYRLHRGANSVGGTGFLSVNAPVNNMEVSPAGSLFVSPSNNENLYIQLGDILSQSIEDAFNDGQLSPNDGEPWDIDGERFVTAKQNGEEKIWRFIGDFGLWGGDDALTDPEINLATYENFDLLSHNGQPNEDLGLLPHLIEDLGSDLIPLNNFEGTLINQNQANTNDLFSVGDCVLNGYAEILINTTGKTQFPRVQSQYSFEVTGFGGTGNFNINGTNYSLIFNTNIEQTITDFQNNNALVLSFSGITITVNGTLIDFTSNSYFSIEYNNVTEDLEAIIYISKGSKLIKPIVFETNKTFKLIARYNGFLIEYFFENIEDITTSPFKNESGGIIVSGRNGLNYGDVGNGAKDLSFSNVESNEYGATGDYSFAAGSLVEASGDYSFAAGENTEASGDYSFAVGNGSKALGIYGFSGGGFCQAIGNFSTALGLSSNAIGKQSISLGTNTRSESFNEISLGAYNTEYDPISTDLFELLDRLFVIGNGTGLERSDALVILKNGLITAPSLTSDLISGDELALINKRYLNETVNKGYFMTSDLFLDDGYTVYTDAPGVSFDCKAGKSYKIEVNGQFNNVNSANGFGYGFRLSSGTGTINGIATTTSDINESSTYQAKPITVINSNNSDDKSVVERVALAQDDEIYPFDGNFIFKCLTDGVFKMTLASESSTVGGTFKAGTGIIVNEIN